MTLAPPRRGIDIDMVIETHIESHIDIDIDIDIASPWVQYAPEGFPSRDQVGH